MVGFHGCELVTHLRFEGHRLLEPVRRLNLRPRAAITVLGRPGYSRLYTASRKRPGQRTTSSSPQRNNKPNSPLHNPETILTESLVLERLTAHATYSSHVPSSTPYEERHHDTDLGGTVSTGQGSKPVPLQITVVASLVFWQPGKMFTTRRVERKVQNKLELLSILVGATRFPLLK